MSQIAWHWWPRQSNMRSEEFLASIIFFLHSWPENSNFRLAPRPESWHFLAVVQTIFFFFFLDTLILITFLAICTGFIKKAHFNSNLWFACPNEFSPNIAPILHFDSTIQSILKEKIHSYIQLSDLLNRISN